MAAVMGQSSYLDYSSKSIKKFHKQATRSQFGRTRAWGWIVLVEDCSAIVARLQLSSLDNCVLHWVQHPRTEGTHHGAKWLLGLLFLVNQRMSYKCKEKASPNTYEGKHKKDRSAASKPFLHSLLMTKSEKDLTHPLNSAGTQVKLLNYSQQCLHINVNKKAFNMLQQEQLKSTCKDNPSRVLPLSTARTNLLQPGEYKFRGSQSTHQLWPRNEAL